MLRCPVCKKKDMAVLELERVEIDFCFECRGIWLDAGELELLLEKPDRKAAVNSAFKDISEEAAREKPRKCPICRKGMNKTKIDAGCKEIIIDRCGKGHGIWFDNGELLEIVKCYSKENDNKVIEFLRDMFEYHISHNGG